MYGKVGIVLEEVAGQFVAPRGPYFCVRAVQEMEYGDR